MQIHRYPKRNEWPELCRRPLLHDEDLRRRVEHIFADVRQKGDMCLREYTKLFDGVDLDQLQATETEIIDAVSQIEPKLKHAIQTSINNIKIFHQAQKETISKTETSPGVYCWRKSVPIERVGLYVPGGSAPLFSSFLMLAIPAQIAGCSEIIVCTPPRKDGSVDPHILYCASLLNLKQIYKVGGAQAIAAMTFGTKTIPAVYKLFGPGNQYVTMAKRLSALYDVAYDMPAGPSEVLIIADDSADAGFVAADLLSQAEHGPDSQVILLTAAENLITEVQSVLNHQLQQLPRKEMAAQALEKSRIIMLPGLNECIDFANFYAAEHLILSITKPNIALEKIQNAGSVFVGHYTPEAAGDYASGTNHTLPTNGFARSFSGISLDSFIKKITFQEILPGGLQELGPVIERLAEAEQLQAHKNAVSIRLKKLNSS